MNCNRARRHLDGAGAERSERHEESLRHHLASCTACADYSQRLETVRAALGNHHTAVAPPAGFARRIQALLQWDDNPIGWAALRLLPASLGLVLLLSWLNLRAAEPAPSEIGDPTMAVLSWVLDPALEDSGLVDSGVATEQPLPAGGDG